MPEMVLASEYTHNPPDMVQRLINMYTHPTPEGPKRSIRLPRPGLLGVAQYGDGPIRASFKWNGLRFVVSGTNAFIDGVLITGTVPGIDLVRYALSDEEVVVVANGKAYTLDATVGITLLTDPDLPTEICDVLFLAGRFVYMDANSSQFAFSDLGDATSVDGLSFATAAENSAEKLIGGAVIGDQIVFFLTTITEWWYATADPNNPYKYSRGRKYDVGTISRDTIANADNTLFFVGSDRIVYRAGAVPSSVSSGTINYFLSLVTEANFSKCQAFAITYRGHVFYILYIFGQGSWAYDITTQKWAKWNSWQRSRFRPRVGDINDTWMGDSETGRMVAFSPTTFWDFDDQPIERVVSGFAPVKGGAYRNFNVYLHAVRGVGLPVIGYGSDPIVEMRYTDHEGQDYTAWLQKKLGTEGERGNSSKAVWKQLKRIQGPGRLYEFRCTDPVYFSVSEALFNVLRP